MRVSVDWSSAEVHDGKLEVELRGEVPREWKESFGRTVALLPGGDWGKIQLKKNRVLVDGVAEGSEDRLHHFLESVVLQANSALNENKDQTGEGAEADDDADDDQTDPQGAEMTKRFRSFAPEAED